MIAESLILITDSHLHEIIGLSLGVTTTALCLSLIIALPLGSFLAMHQSKACRLVTVVLHGLLGLPPVVAGLAVYLMLSRSGPLGFLGLLYSPSAMIMAQMLIIIPIVAVHCYQAVSARKTQLRMPLVSMGASRMQIVLTLLHDVRHHLLTAILAGFGRGISEVGAVAIVGGNIDHHTRVMTTAIALETAQGDLARAMALGGILLLIALVINWLAWRIMHIHSHRQQSLLP